MSILIGFLFGVVFTCGLGFYVFHTFINFELADEIKASLTEIPKSEIPFPKSAGPAVNILPGSKEDLDQ